MRSTIKHIDKTERDPNQDKNAMQYGMMLTKYGIIPIIASNINGLIVGMFFGPVSLAFYTVGIGLSNKLIVLTRPSLSTLFTKYSKESKISKTFIIFVICFSIFLFFTIQIILPFFLQILFPLYIDSITYGRLHAFTLLFYPLITVLSYYFRGKVEEKIIKLSISIPNISAIALIFPMLYLFDIYGLILIEIIKYIITLLIFIIYSKKIEFI
jgi:O-antigen/teichoic acid export membrane protein